MPIWRPFTPYHAGMVPPLHIVRARGAYLYDSEGRSFWDGTCAWWVTVHGHAHPYIARAIARQAHTLDHVLFGDALHPPAITLADKLVARTGLPYVFFSDNGSTAIEIALKMALQYFYNLGQPRYKILALEGAYHGDTFGAMAVSERDIFVKPFEKLLFAVEWLPFPTPENSPVLQKRLAEIAEDTTIAAFIGEPLLQGVAGMRPYPAFWWDAIASAVHQAGGLVIADEVFTGFGRTGTLFAIDQCQEKPDLLCLSKGLTGGFLPLAITLATNQVFEAFYGEDPARTFYHGHSYTGNPIACAAAVANLELWERSETWDALQQLIQTQAQLVSTLSGQHPDLNVRQTGLVLALDLPGERTYQSEHRHHLKAFALERGVYLRPLGSTAYVLPTLASRPDELAYAVEVLEAYVALVSASSA